MTNWTSEREFSAALSKGMDAAIEEWLSRFAAPLYNLAFQFTRSKEDAEDVVQETLVRTLNSVPLPDMDAPLKPWVFKVAVNLCRDHARRRRSDTFSDLAGSDVDEIPEEWPGPETEMELKEGRHRLRRAVDALPVQERLAVTLRYNEDLSYEEIALVMDVPVQTVGTHLFRARQRLRNRLEADDASFPA